MESMTKRIQNCGWTSLCLAFLALAGSGCSKAGSTTTVSAVTYLSIIQGAPISGGANVYLNDTLITPSAFNPGTFSPKYGTIRPGSYTVKFKKSGTDSLFDQLVPSTYDTLNFYTLLLYNNTADKAAHALKIFDDFSSISNNNAYYRFFNLAPAPRFPSPTGPLPTMPSITSSMLLTRSRRARRCFPSGMRRLTAYW